jgi:general secretion pathway protein C
MEKILTKYFWVLNIVTLALVAYFLASGTSQVVASKLEALMPAPKETKKAPAKRRTPASGRVQAPPNGDAILARNIFDSALGPVSRLEETLSSNPADLQPVESGQMPLVPCTDGSVKIISLVASRGQVDWSFASVEEGGKTRMLRVGDDAAGRTVSGITWRYLFLRGSSDECYLDMFPDPNAPAPKPATVQTAAVDKSAKEGQYADRIQKKSETEAEIERSLVNELLADPTKFIRSVRVRPHRQGGKVVGYKLRRFRADSPLALLGAKRGDIIHSVNGAELTSVDKALGAYQNMRSANDLTFSITRQGKPMELKLSIR